MFCEEYRKKINTEMSLYHQFQTAVIVVNLIPFFQIHLHMFKAIRQNHY